MRGILFGLALFLVPYMAYVLFARWERWRLDLPENLRPTPWLPLAMAGLLLAAIAGLASALVGGATPGGRYVPAHIGADGLLVPAQVVPGDASEPPRP